MPPLQALVALHGLWVLALVPFVVWAAHSWQPPRLRLVGKGLSAAGLGGLAILIGRELLTSYAAAPSAQISYIAQRILYVLGTNTAFPVMQVVLTGAILRFVGRKRKAVAPWDKANPPGDQSVRFKDW